MFVYREGKQVPLAHVLDFLFHLLPVFMEWISCSLCEEIGFINITEDFKDSSRDCC